MGASTKYIVEGYKLVPLAIEVYAVTSYEAEIEAEEMGMINPRAYQPCEKENDDESNSD